MQLKEESLEGTDAKAWNISGIQEGTAAVGLTDLERAKDRAGIMDGVQIVGFGGIEKVVGGTKVVV